MYVGKKDNAKHYLNLFNILGEYCFKIFIVYKEIKKNKIFNKFYKNNGFFLEDDSLK